MIIHLSGPDTYRSQRRLHQLREAFRQRHDPRGFNTITLDGQTATLEEIRTALTTVGLFAAKRFLAINGYQAKGSACSPGELSAAIAPLADDQDQIVVIRQVDPLPTSTRARPAAKKKRVAGKKADARSMETLDLSKAKIETFPLLGLPDMKRWLLSEAQVIGTTIDPLAAERLLAACGPDVWRLANELEKLAAYAGGHAISVADVEAMVIAPEVSDLFALTDALGTRRVGDALRFLRQEFSAGTHPLMLTTSLARHIYRLWSVRQAVAEKVSPEAMPGRLGLHPFVVKKCLAQSQQFTDDQLRTLHRRVTTIDAEMKSTPLDAEALLDILMLGR